MNNIKYSSRRINLSSLNLINLQIQPLNHYTRRINTIPSPTYYKFSQSIQRNLFKSLSTATETATNIKAKLEKKLPEKETFKSISKKYGYTAFLVYTFLTTLLFTSVFSAITYSGLTPNEIEKKVKSFKDNYLPFLVSQSKEEQIESIDEESKIVSWFKKLGISENLATHLTNAVLAMTLTKLVSPLKIALSIAVTPSVAKRLKFLRR